MLNPHLGEEHLFFELERNVLPEEDNSVLFFIVFWLLINILYILFYYYTTIITLDEACLNKIKEKETKQKYPSKSTASCPRTNI